MKRSDIQLLVARWKDWEDHGELGTEERPILWLLERVLKLTEGEKEEEVSSKKKKKYTEANLIPTTPAIPVEPTTITPTLGVRTDNPWLRNHYDTFTHDIFTTPEPTTAPPVRNRITRTYNWADYWDSIAPTLVNRNVMTESINNQNGRVNTITVSYDE